MILWIFNLVKTNSHMVYISWFYIYKNSYAIILWTFNLVKKNSHGVYLFGLNLDLFCNFVFIFQLPKIKFTHGVDMCILNNDY